MKLQEWKAGMKLAIRTRDEILRRRIVLKAQSYLADSIQVNDVHQAILNAMYEVDKDFNHCNFIIDRLTSNDVLSTIEDIKGGNGFGTD